MERGFMIKRALLRALAECGIYALPESALIESVSIKIDHLRPTTAEIDAQLKASDTERLCVSTNTERGRKYQITDAGSLWLAANS
jgi:hypothetical protein